MCEEFAGGIVGCNMAPAGLGVHHAVAVAIPIGGNRLGIGVLSVPFGGATRPFGAIPS